MKILHPIFFRFTNRRSFFRKLCLLALVWIAMGEYVSAQDKLQVVQKRVEKTLSWSPGQEVNIKGEKAEVLIEAWNKDEIHIVFELMAKHPQRERAERELEQMGYLAETQGNRIFIRNFIIDAEDGTKPASLLKARILITLPEKCPVNLSNHIGEANIKDLINGFNITSEFCKITLYDVAGKIDIDTRFGDIAGTQLNGRVNIVANRSDIMLQQIRGIYDIKAKYGIINIHADDPLTELNIEAEKSNVFLFTPKGNVYDYSLTSHFGNIFVPSNMDFDFTEIGKNLQRAILRANNELASVSIKIRVNFGDIAVKHKNP